MYTETCIQLILVGKSIFIMNNLSSRRSMFNNGSKTIKVQREKYLDEIFTI